MKKLCIFLALILQGVVAITSTAQAPQNIPYQAVARDSIGNTLNNQSISIRFSIHDSSSTGTIVYQESQNITTTSLGLFSVNIGQGIPISGSIASVNWQQGSKYLQTEMDMNGGINFVNMGTTQLMSVPYALSSGDNQWTKNGNNISNNNNGSVSIGGAIPDSTAKLDISSTNKGFLMPRMTMAQRLAIQNPADGLQVFQTDTLCGVYAYFKKYQNWFIQTFQNDISFINKKEIYTPLNSLQTFVVPSGVTTLKVTVNGASGGTGTDYVVSWLYSYFPGAPGQRITGTMNVNPGDTLILSTGVYSGTALAGPFPDGNAGSQATWVEVNQYPYSCGLGATCYYTQYDTHYATAGSSGGSSRIFINDTTASNLVVRSSGGNGGTNGHATPGIAAPYYISSSIHNTILSVDTSTNQSGWIMIEYSLPTNLFSFTNAGSGNGSTSIANTNTTGSLTSGDWNTFNNKINGSGNVNELAFFNGSKNITSSPNLKWDNANARLDVDNIKINTLSGGSSTQILAVDTSGKIVATTYSPSGDNFGNHTAFQTVNLNNNFISNNGNKIGLKLDNNGYAAIGLDSTVTAFSAPLNVNSLNNGTGVSNWIASNIGGKSGSRVVSGLYNGMATIGAHDYGLTTWDNLKINPSGNVAIGDITPLVKLDINGTLRATNIGIGTTTPQRELDVRGDIALGMWSDNIPSRRIGVMDNTTHVAGIEIENTTLGGNYSQKLHLLSHRYGAGFGRRFTIDEDGNVGIGTTAPTNKLSVQGNANITGTLSTTGNTTIAGSLNVNSISAVGTISTNTNASVAGTVTAGNVTTAGTVSASNVSTTNITSSKFKVTEVWNNVAGNPGLGLFTSGGGTLLLNISAMAYQNIGGPAPLTIDVYMDGIVVATLKGFATQSATQLTLTSNFKVIAGQAAGNHNISIVPVGSTIVDVNSFISASILELPF